MSGFSAAWLALREPHDAAARAAELVGLLRTHPPTTHNGADTALVPRAIVDLGAGSGANLRWLAPRLGGEQAWLLVDHDAALLAAAENALLAWAKTHGANSVRGPADDGSLGEIVVAAADFRCRVRRTRADLAADLEHIQLPERAVVTSSALLDLVSAEWLDALVRRCVGASADVYFSLVYDGRTVCTPADDADAEVLGLLQPPPGRRQGLRRRAGPTAGLRAVDAFVARGYRVGVAGDERLANRPKCGAVPARAALGLARRGARNRAATACCTTSGIGAASLSCRRGRVDARRRSPRHDRNLHALATR